LLRRRVRLSSGRLRRRLNGLRFWGLLGGQSKGTGEEDKGARPSYQVHEEGPAVTFDAQPPSGESELF
jgi:hypothetical protein